MEKRFEFLNMTPGIWTTKDINSKVTFCSMDLAKMLGWNNIEEPIGTTDFDIPCRVSEFAETFILWDKMIMDVQKPALLLDIMPYAVGWRIFLAEKKITTNEAGDITGTIGQCIDVTDVSIFKKCLLLNDTDSKKINSTNKPRSYALNSEYSPLPVINPLTNQQENCLFLLVRGKCPKKIADILGISIRTVESHIEKIRHKLGCCSKSQLIEKAIDSGYFYYIPKDILDNIGTVWS